MSSKNSEGEGTWDGLELASNVRNWMGPETLKTWCIFWGDKYLLVTCPKNNLGEVSLGISIPFSDLGLV